MIGFKKNLFSVIFIFLMLLPIQGCVYLVVGSVGAVGGYVISPDTVEGILYDYSSEEVWAAAREVVSIMGVILEEAEAGGVLIAKINGAKVTMAVSDFSASSVKLTIKARRAFLPRICVAQDVYIKIVNYLKEGK